MVLKVLLVFWQRTWARLTIIRGSNCSIPIKSLGTFLTLKTCSVVLTGLKIFSFLIYRRVKLLVLPFLPTILYYTNIASGLSKQKIAIMKGLYHNFMDSLIASLGIILQSFSNTSTINRLLSK